jgi:tryptophanyl-tRNA synthetase
MAEDPYSVLGVAKTDPEPLPSELKGLESRPEADNLVGIYAGLAETGKDQVLAEFGGATFSKFKEALAELAASRLTPIGEEMRRLMADPVEIDRILADGASRAHGIADPILAKTKDIVGFIRN